MSSKQDAIKACKILKVAMSSGDVKKVQQVLNKHVKSPNTAAKSYIHGVWQVSRRFCTDKDFNHPTLYVTPLGEWHCYRIDDPN